MIIHEWNRQRKVLQPLAIISTLTIILFTGPATQEQPKAPRGSITEKEILSIESVKNKAMQDGDAAVLDQIYGDRLIFVDTSGRALTKVDRMRSFETGNLQYISFDQGDYKVHLYGDTAVISGSSCSVVNNHGRVIKKPRRFMTVYVKLDGRWRYVAHQATVVAETKDFPKCEK